MAKDRIVHVTSAHPPFDIRIFHKQCKTLAAEGYEVILIVPHDSDVMADGVRIHAVSKPKGRLERMTLTAFRCAKIALRERAGLYHFHDPELLPWLFLFRLLRKNVVYDMHENVPKSILTKFWIGTSIRRIVAFIYRWVERLLIGNAPVVFAETSYTRDYEWVRRGTVILNMPLVDHLLAVHEQKHSGLTVAYIGGVSAARGSLVTMEALRILHGEGLKVGWECVGSLSETHRRLLVEKAAQYEIGGVRIRGYMLPEEGWKLVARCHLGLALLRPIPNYIESYPTKIFEYMALGLPVVASDFPLYREVIERNGCGLCVNAEDPAQVAVAIRRILENPEWAAEMGQRGRDAVKDKYNWTFEAKKLSALYRELLACS